MGQMSLFLRDLRRAALVSLVRLRGLVRSRSSSSRDPGFYTRAVRYLATNCVYAIILFSRPANKLGIDTVLYLVKRKILPKVDNRCRRAK